MRLTSMGRYVLFGTLVFVALLYIIPLTATGVLVLRTTEMMERVGTFSTRTIATGGNPRLERVYHKELLDKAAFPGEAPRNNTHLNVALVSIDEAPSASTLSEIQRAFVSITYNVKDIGKAANLLIADGPTHWKLEGQSLVQRAKLAIEGRSAVRATGVQQGFIAGVRIKGVDTNEASGAHTVLNDRRTFCQSLNDWAAFFDIGMDKIKVWHAVMPASGADLQAINSGFRTPNGHLRYANRATRLCKDI